MSIKRCAVGATLLLVAACGRPVGPAGDEPNLPVSTPISTPAETRALPGDMPPNHVDNEAWKQPKPITPQQRQAAEVEVAKIQPPLEQLRAAGDFTVESTRKALAGYQDLGVQGMNKSPLADEPAPPGAVFGFRVGAACVIGAVRPERVQIQVSGPVAEWGCNPVGPTH